MRRREVSLVAEGKGEGGWNGEVGRERGGGRSGRGVSAEKEDGNRGAGSEKGVRYVKIRQTTIDGEREGEGERGTGADRGTRRAREMKWEESGETMKGRGGKKRGTGG